MHTVLSTRELLDRGLATHELARLERRGELVRVRRGAYVPWQGPEPGSAEDPFASADLAEQHQRLLRGTLPQLHPRAVISHGSAAVLHGLPVFPAAVQHVHLTRDRRGGGVRRSVVHVHGSPLSATDVTCIDGVMVTSLARTVADLARTLPYPQAVAIGDHALARGLEPTVLAAAVESAASWAGAAQARRVAGFVDGRSESVGESYSRVGFDRDGVPAPVVQLEVFDRRGALIGRTDFGWPTYRTLGEFDGMAKYRRLRRAGETVEDTVTREKLREDALRALGWQVVRWTWADLFRPGVVADRLRQAFDRAGR